MNSILQVGTRVAKTFEARTTLELEYENKEDEVVVVIDNEVVILPTAFSALISKAIDKDCVGIPEIVPELGSKRRPVGRLPDMIEKVRESPSVVGVIEVVEPIIKK